MNLAEVGFSDRYETISLEEVKIGTFSKKKLYSVMLPIWVLNVHVNDAVASH